MIKIAVVTATRAEYGLLSPVIRKLRECEDDTFRTDLIVTGTHLSEQYGQTITEIQERIDYRIKTPVKSDSEEDISNNQAKTLVLFTQLFKKNNYDSVVLLGDRYEMLAIAIAAGNTRTPIFHISGGDTTEGAIDEWIRHSITKMSYLHFTTNEISRKRVIQLGEDPKRVFNFGSTSIDNVLNIANMNRLEALNSIGLSDCRYALCTFHPITMDDCSDIDEQIKNLFDAIQYYSDIQFVMTKANADQGGSRINELLDSAGRDIKNLHVYASLGVRRYLSLMKNAEFVMGNSSSGIIETPAFHLPTVNIGDRQKGRLQSESIINCTCDKNEIVNAIKTALSPTFVEVCRKTESPYGDGNAAEKIANKVVEAVKKGNLDLKKKFYDIDLAL